MLSFTIATTYPLTELSCGPFTYESTVRDNTGNKRLPREMCIIGGRLVIYKQKKAEPN